MFLFAEVHEGDAFAGKRLNHCGLDCIFALEVRANAMLALIIGQINDINHAGNCAQRFFGFGFCALLALGGYTFPGTAADSAPACAAPSEVGGAGDEVDSTGVSTGLGE